MGALMNNPDQPDRVEHRMERTYEVTATPEQVWDAIATADGISAWMVPTRLEPVQRYDFVSPSARAQAALGLANVASQ